MAGEKPARDARGATVSISSTGEPRSRWSLLGALRFERCLNHQDVTRPWFCVAPRAAQELQAGGAGTHMSDRSSIVSPGPTNCETISCARSGFATSMMKKPAKCSLASE